MKKALFILMTALMLSVFAACGAQEAAPAESEAEPAAAAALPTAQSVEVTTDNQGEEAQHVNFIFSFDAAPAGLDAADFEVVLADEPVAAEDMALIVEGDTATLTLTVFAVKAGHVDLAYTGGAAAPFTVEAVVSPGVELETVAQDKDAASVTVRVSELPRVRGIVRVLLLEDGQPVETQAEPASPFTAVHCHDFLNMDGPAVAEKIAYCLGESFPEGYTATADGDTVTVTKTDAAAPAELELTVQEWAELESE